MLLQAKKGHKTVVCGKPTRLNGHHDCLIGGGAQQSSNAQQEAISPLLMPATWSVHLALKVTNCISKRKASERLIEPCERREAHRVGALALKPATLEL